MSPGGIRWRVLLSARQLDCSQTVQFFVEHGPTPYQQTKRTYENVPIHLKGELYLCC